jgi:diguanylate cyclase (GGDEF)-like protein
LHEEKQHENHPLLLAAESSPFKRSTLDFEIKGNSFTGSFVRIPSQEGLYLIVESNRESLVAELKSVAAQQVLIAIILAAFCMIAALLFSKRITGPLHSLMEFADNLAAGRYGEKSNVSTRDELGELADHFTRLSEKLLARERQLEVASDLASRDGMTGLFNFRFFSQKLEQQLPVAARDGLPLDLLLIDVDHFKKVNDTFGHPQGDYVLKTLATLLLRCARLTDYVCRYGGEEFVILTSPETTQEGSAIFAERIRSSFEELDIEILDRPGEFMKVTLSIGIATFLPNADFRAPVPQPQELIKTADSKLYQAKASGRNRVVA